MTIDYLSQISKTRSIPKLATLVRAFGCQIAVATYRVKDGAEAIDVAYNAEVAAGMVERAASLTEARKILLDQKYMLKPCRNVRCKFCKTKISIKDAHRYRGKYVGECCWDERLRATE